MKKIREITYDAIMTATRRAFQDTVQIYRTDKYGAKTMTFGVNWCAIGTTSPEGTLEFAERLKRAAEIAQILNEQEYSRNFEDEDEEFTEEEYEAAVEWMAKGIRLGHFKMALDFTVNHSKEMSRPSNN